MACLLTCEQDSGQLGRDGGGKAGSGRELLPPMGGRGSGGEGWLEPGGSCFKERAVAAATGRGRWGQDPFSLS